MRIQSKLCHISESRVVVSVVGWVNGQKVGSALAEATKVEIAEDSAILRLKNRLNEKNNEVTESHMNNIETEKSTEQNSFAQNNSNENNDKILEIPNDWSKELLEIDTEIKRLNWSRDDEINFLETNLGYNNRNKITNYRELIKYLKLLKCTETNENLESENLNIQDLINESDMILKDLSWDNRQGREFLRNEFNVSTRKELNKIQLISFINKLKEIR